MAKQFIATTLMDGYADGPHITEAQTGIANQGLYGPDDYVLDEGKKAEAQILTNNSVRVFDATFVIQGRRDVMAANAYADVTIANGEQGMYRNDIIVRKYEKDEVTEIENTSFDVIKGTPSSGVATDPEIPTGDIRTGATMHNMALYRVKLEGLNIVALEPMFKVLYNMADIKKELESLNGKLKQQLGAMISGVRQTGTGGRIYAQRNGEFIDIDVVLSGCAVGTTYAWYKVGYVDLSTWGIISTKQAYGQAYFSGGGPAYGDDGGLATIRAREQSSGRIQLEAQGSKAISDKMYIAAIRVPIGR